MTKMYAEMQKGFNNVYEDMHKGFEQVNVRLDKLENRMDNVENAVVRIENDHGQKLAVLFDGYKQNSEKLDRIEAEVTKHEEIILRRIR